MQGNVTSSLALPFTFVRAFGLSCHLVNNANGSKQKQQQQ
jgi:hypothetical protein